MSNSDSENSSDSFSDLLMYRRHLNLRDFYEHHATSEEKQFCKSVDLKVLLEDVVNQSTDQEKCLDFWKMISEKFQNKRFLFWKLITWAGHELKYNFLAGIEERYENVIHCIASGLEK